MHYKQLSLAMACFAGTVVVFAESPPVPPATDRDGATLFVAQLAARLIAEAIPREYERYKDWGRTRQITTGLRSSGNFFDFDIHRRKSKVNHGMWKHYRLRLVEPEKNLVVRIENLRSIEPGRIALTLFIKAKLRGWARAKVYDRGIHLIAVEADGESSVRLWIDCEIAMEAVSVKPFLPGVAVRPVVRDARLKLDEFRLERVSDVKGPLVHELGDGLRHVIEDELAGPKLVAKLNRSLEKRRERLEFTPDMLFGKAVPIPPTDRSHHSELQPANKF